MENQEEAKLERFLLWLQANGVEFRGSKIKYCGPNKGFGIFSGNHSAEEVPLVVPLDLAITPMRVLQDPTMGPKCRAMFEEGDVDDRFLMILFLTVERLRRNSSWKPYLDMLPTKFGNSLWFTDDELLELKGTSLYRATVLQKKTLQSLFEDKVRDLVKEIIPDGESGRDVHFEDFLWANSIFWTRALTIPFPHSYVFSQMPEDQDKDPGSLSNQTSSDLSNNMSDQKTQEEAVWVEGLVPGIDFCNHDLKAAATWEVDGTGTTTGYPSSMYLLSAQQSPLYVDKEISISYGNKGNEELLYLYGFVIYDNPDDYLMVNYPVEAFKNVPFADSKGQLLEAQKAELRCLLPRSLLDHGLFSGSFAQNAGSNNCQDSRACNFSWSGQRKVPSYLNKLVFPEDFLTALRTIAMKEDELIHVSSLLEELVGCGEERQPSDAEVRAAVWEACGDSGALQMLVDLLNMKMLELEEGSGTEDCDTKLLEKAYVMEVAEEDKDGADQVELMSRNTWSSIIYRRGQKQLTRLFLMEAEKALQLCLSEQC